MPQGKKRKSWIGWLLAGMMVLALGGLFLPLAATKTLAGETIPFYGWVLIFGGNVESVLDSGTYSFTFNVNIALLVLTQCFLLSAVSCLLGGQSMFNRILSLGFAVVCFAGLAMVPWFITLFSPIPYEGLEFGYGAWISFGFCVATIAMQILWIVLGKKDGKSEEKAAEIKDS